MPPLRGQPCSSTFPARTSPWERPRTGGSSWQTSRPAASAAYLYTAAGFGESTTDLAWDGQGLIYENGTKLAESKRFSYDSQLVTGDVDLDRLSQDRMRQGSFGQSVHRHSRDLADFSSIVVDARHPA